MTLPLSSVIPAVKAALVTQLAARSGLADVQVNYAWAGLAQEGESMTLDPPNETVLPAGSTIPTLVGGRHPRQEEFIVIVSIQVYRGALDSSSAATTEARAFTLLAELDDLLAATWGPGLGGAVAGSTLVCTIGDYPRTLVPFDRGWMSRIDVNVNCACRLT